MSVQAKIKLLKALAEAAEDHDENCDSCGNGEKMDLDQDAMREKLEAFAKSAFDLAVGDYVVLNPEFRGTYKDWDGKALQKVVEVFDFENNPEEQSGSERINGTIATIFPAGQVRVYTVDLRYYKKAA